jgi:hypothetical protein
VSRRARVRSLLGRVIPDFRSAVGRAIDREFLVIVAGLAIDGDPLLRREAARVALLTVRSRESARALADVTEKRRAGRGRKPNLRAVERAARRAALDDGSAAQALDRLRELAGERRPLDLARAIQQAQAAAEAKR